MAHQISLAEPQDRDTQPSSAVYGYAPFEDDYSVRILTLQPGVGDEPLIGSLSIEHLDFNPTYEAISYVWGHESRASEILCDGKPLHLTNSIQGALQRIRHPTLPRRLWADQICINQNDVAERSQQVRLMNAIYKGAKQILVWLGLDTDGCAQEAFKMILHLHEVFGDEEKHNAFKLAHSEELLKQNEDLWIPVSKLTKLPWFNRMWIVQEIGTAAPATLYWGDAEVEWEILSYVVDILNRNYHYLRSRFAILTPSVRYLYQRFVEPADDYDVHHNRGNFIYELHRARHLLAKDPRDHIYAFLGHFSLSVGSKALSELKADYGRPVEDVFYDVAVRELTGAESLLLLSAAHLEPLASKKKDRERTLPSWVPDWRITSLHLLISPNSPHRAAGNTRPKLWINDAEKALHIRGVQADKIAATSWTLYGKGFQFRDAPTARLPIEIIWNNLCGYRRFDLKHKYPNGDAAFFALIQTLTNGGIGTDPWRPYDSIPQSEWIANGAAYLVRAKGQAIAMSNELREIAVEGDAYRWSHEATLVARFRKFAVTEGGLFLIGPDTMEAGDAIVVLYGGRMAFVLRKRTTANWWVLIGECYVHGLMSGEALKNEALVEEEFIIL